MAKDKDDLLGRFRRPGAAPQAPAAKADAPAPVAVDGLQPYVAFEAKDKLQRLQIRRVLGATHAPSYGYLLDVSFDGAYGTNFVLLYSFGMQIEVRGKNLQPVVQAILLGKCEFIQDFHAEEHQPPAAEAPVIENIDIVVKLPSGTGEGEKKPSR